jgi:hypothetical protein
MFKTVSAVTIVIAFPYVEMFGFLASGVILISLLEFSDSLFYPEFLNGLEYLHPKPCKS